MQNSQTKGWVVMLSILAGCMVFTVTSAYKKNCHNRPTPRHCGTGSACLWAICPFDFIPGSRACQYLCNASCRCAFGRSCQLTDYTFPLSREDTSFLYQCLPDDTIPEDTILLERTGK